MKRCHARVRIPHPLREERRTVTPPRRQRGPSGFDPRSSHRSLRRRAYRPPVPKRLLTAVAAAACLSGHPGRGLLTPLDGPGPCPDLPVLATPPVSPVEPEPDPRVLGEWSTRFSLADANRASNVRLAASRVDGVRIAPGSTLSFNSLVGPRTEQNGFLQAPAIFLGEKILDVGGGMCQVSSTLHAVAVVSKLEVTHRRPHSRPVPYVAPGLDATVVMPSPCAEGEECPEHVDLVLRNPHPFEVRVSATTSEDRGAGVLTVRLLGGELGQTAKVHPSFEWTDGFEVRERTIPWRKPGDRRLKQKGERGRRATVRVVFTSPDGKREVRILRSTYKPVPEVWEVGPQPRYEEGDE